MAYNYKEFTYASGDGKSHIAACLYTPKDRTVRAVVQIVHGMRDYMGRYREMAEVLCEQGYAVCGGDHLGHGHTARHSDELGFFAAEDGADTVVTDVHKLTLLMRSQFNGSPLILMGHSMGSLIARLYACSYYRDIDGIVILGTANNRAAGLGRRLARLVARRYGPAHRSEFLTKLAFGKYNKKVNKYDPAGPNWLSRDDAAVTAHVIDPLCNFTFTASAYADLFSMLERVSSPRFAQEYPKSLPTLIAAGDMDPVGSYGRAPRALAARLSAAGTKDVTLKLYTGARHELFNETCRKEFFGDLIAWLSERS
jgi:alpha-beta hydrolase superfamily lysophospholipase